MPVPTSSSSLTPITEVTKKRRQSNLKDPVRIPLAQEWKEGNQLFDWYTHRSSRFIDKIQLRRERESPFFHEYVAFNLRDNGGCFRVDRRQCSNGNTSFGRTYNPGVEAHDTMEEVTSLDDTLYGSSDCLIELELEAYIDVDVKLVLDICRAIRTHSQARVYSPQRYNCYFFAQTIVACAARTFLELYHTGRPINDQSMLKRPPTIRGTRVNYLQFKSAAEPLLFHSTRQAHESFPEGAPGVTIPHRITCLDHPDDFDDSSRIQASSTDSMLSGTTLRDDTCVDSRAYLSSLTAELCSSPCVHQSPSCQFPAALDPASDSVAWELSDAVNQANSLLRGFWDNLLSSTLHAVATYDPFAQGLWVVFRDSHIRNLWREAGDGLVRPEGDHLRIRQLWSEFSGHVLDCFMITVLERSSSNPRSAYSTIPKRRRNSKVSVSVLRENAELNEWRNAMVEFFDSEYENLEQALWQRAAVRRSEYSLWCHTAKRVTQQGSNGLKQRVQIRLNFEALGARGIWRTYTQGNKASSGSLQLSTYGEMQNFIKELIHAHSTRVGQYKMMLKCTAPEVKETIRSAMSDIWHALNNTSGHSNAIPIDLSDFEQKLESLKASHLL